MLVHRILVKKDKHEKHPQQAGLQIAACASDSANILMTKRVRQHTEIVTTLSAVLWALPLHMDLRLDCSRLRNLTYSGMQCQPTVMQNLFE